MPHFYDRLFNLSIGREGERKWNTGFEVSVTLKDWWGRVLSLCLHVSLPDTSWPLPASLPVSLPPSLPASLWSFLLSMHTSCHLKTPRWHLFCSLQLVSSFCIPSLHPVLSPCFPFRLPASSASSFRPLPLPCLLDLSTSSLLIFFLTVMILVLNFHHLFFSYLLCFCCYSFLSSSWLRYQLYYIVLY